MKLAFLNRRYFNRLENDMKGWVKSGWVSEENATQILSASKPAPTKYYFTTIIGVLGAILLGFAALSFVGANWQHMSKISRIVLLFAVMWAAFGAGWLMERKNAHGFKEAAYLLGGVLFGVNIALIAQIYHIDRHPPDGLMLWGAGMVLIAAALESKAALAASFVIITIWTGMETNWVSGYHLSKSVHWGFLVLWGFATFLTSKQKWFPAYHLVIISFGVWLLLTFLILTDGYFMSSLSAISGLILLMVMLVLGALLFVKKEELGLTERFMPLLLLYSLAVIAIVPLFTQMAVGNRLFRYAEAYGQARQNFSIWGLVLFILPVAIAIGWLLKQHFDLRRYKLINLVFLGLISLWCTLFIIALSLDIKPLVTFLANAGLFRVFMLAIAVWLVSFGLELLSTKLVNLGLFSFGVEVLYIYVKLFGSLMDTSLFFLLGGIVLIGLAYGLERMRRKLSGTQTDQKGDEL